MKTYFLTVFLFIIYFSSTALIAQPGMLNNGMGQGINGVDRSIARPQMNNTPKKAEKVDYLQLTVDKLTKELTLDDFQKVVIRELLVENKIEEDKVLIQSVPAEIKFEKIKNLRLKLDASMMKILSKEQSEKLIKIKEKAEKEKKR